MKKFFIIILIITFLSGCASYKFQKTQVSAETEGYTVAREDKIIPEYTIGKDNSLPGLRLAEQRFKRRKGKVEYYYKQMDYIRNRFNDGVRTYLVLFAGMATTLFRLPGAAIIDYRYTHDPKYKARMDKMYAAEDAAEDARIAWLKQELNSYMQRDFALEEKTLPVSK